MNYEIKRWFGDTIMIISLDHKAFNEDIKKLILKDVDPDPGRFAKTTDKEEGDKELIDNLHRNKKFDKLFIEVRKAIYKYLEEQDYRSDVFDVFITKAWATLTNKDQLITPHKHTASHFSLVYYVEAEEQGNLTFHKERDGLFIPCSTEYYMYTNNYNMNDITYNSRTGDLVIFPSSMMHRTEPNTKDRARISIGIDVLLTMKEGITSEHNLPNPKTWKQI